MLTDKIGNIRVHSKLLIQHDQPLMPIVILNGIRYAGIFKNIFFKECILRILNNGRQLPEISQTAEMLFGESRCKYDLRNIRHTCLIEDHHVEFLLINCLINDRLRNCCCDKCSLAHQLLLIVQKPASDCIQLLIYLCSFNIVSSEFLFSFNQFPILLSQLRSLIQHI